MLRLADVEVSYGKSVHAARGISLEVSAGTVVAVLGANGAGKTTLLRAVSGTLALHRGTVTSGEITFGGHSLVGENPAAIVARGIVQVPEGRRVFSGLTIEENLRAGTLGPGRRSHAANRAAHERVMGLFPILAERRHQRAGLLSGGEQQMLAMGRALMAAPKLLLLDEPSLGLAPRMVGRIADVISEIHRQGTSVLLVEQNAAVALELSTRAYVLEVGRVRLSGASADLARSDEVRRLYMGEEEEAEDMAVAAGGPGPETAVRTRTRLLERWQG
jgi:branched-chain amino acid transport system ATP-binding protein